MEDITIRIKWSKIIPYEKENSDEVPEESGVYEILVRQKRKNEYLRRYVGRREDLKEAFLIHLSPGETNECIKDRVRNYICGFDYALLKDEDDQKDAELALYRKYKDQLHCNLVEPEGSGRGGEIELIEEQ